MLVESTVQVLLRPAQLGFRTVTRNLMLVVVGYVWRTSEYTDVSCTAFFSQGAAKG